jgi:hypothetical protein
MERFFFDSDADSHWHMIPYSRLAEWQQATDSEDDEAFLAFEECRIDGHPSEYTFTDPQVAEDIEKP